MIAVLYVEDTQKTALGVMFLLITFKLQCDLLLRAHECHWYSVVLQWLILAGGMVLFQQTDVKWNENQTMNFLVHLPDYKNGWFH